MKRVLLIHSRVRHEVRSGEHALYEKAGKGLATFACISTLDKLRAWNDPAALLEGYDAVIIGGSSDFDFDGGRDEHDPARATSREILHRIRPLIEYILATRFPLLGVCYGHQLIAEICAGTVSHDESQQKIGTFEVSLTDAGKEDRLFEVLPERFLAQYGHKDSVTSLPLGATLLATGPSCRFSALRYGARAYTTQFHPELDAEDAIRRFDMTTGYLPEGVHAAEVVRESPEASRLIPAFLERVAGAPIA